MYYLGITLFLLLSLTGCENKQIVQENNNTIISMKTKSETLTHFAEQNKITPTPLQELTPIEQKSVNKAPQSETPSNKRYHEELAPLGIHVKEDSFTVDTNQTKRFLNQLTSTIKKKMQKLSNDFSNGVIDNKEVGVEINRTNIHIDLDKTEGLLQQWGKEIEVFVEKFDTIAKEKENTTIEKENNATN